jgi:hypothetical protein
MSGILMYDANCNMIGNKIGAKRQYVYSYDYKNRLIQIEKNIYIPPSVPPLPGEGSNTEPTQVQKIV